MRGITKQRRPGIVYNPPPTLSGAEALDACPWRRSLLVELEKMKRRNRKTDIDAFLICGNSDSGIAFRNYNSKICQRTK